MLFRRLRARLDRLENQASETMSTAEELLLELLDGVDFELIRTGEATIIDFLSGKERVFPFKVRLKVEEGNTEPRKAEDVVDENGIIQAIAEDGTPIQGQFRGHSVARELMEKGEKEDDD